MSVSTLSPDERCRELEEKSFLVYLARFRVLILVVSVLFLTAYGVSFKLIPEGAMYSRMFGDPLKYYMKISAFVEEGHLQPTMAENIAPFPYVSFPGILRAPLYHLADDFDGRLLVIQLSNLLVFVFAGVLFGYFLWFFVPDRLMKFVIGVPFLCFVADGIWQGNVFLPFIDQYFTLVTLLAVLVIKKIRWGNQFNRFDYLKIALVMVLIVVATLLKIIGVFLFVYLIASSLCLARREQRKWLLGVLGVSSIFVSVVVLFFVDSSSMYIKSGLGQLAEPADVFRGVYNYLMLGVPSQFVPNLIYLFHASVERPVAVVGKDLIDIKNVGYMFLVGGIWFSIVLGIVKEWRRFVPEIVFVFVAVPALITYHDSTVRYLHYYQVFYWLFFIFGMRAMARYVGMDGARKIFRSSILVLVIAVVFLGYRHLKQRQYFSQSDDLGYFDQLALENKRTADFLQENTSSNSRLLFHYQSPWKAILGREYYKPDQNMVKAMQQHDFWFVMHCEIAFCPSDLDEYVKNILEGSEKIAGMTLNLNLEYQSQSQATQTKIFRISSQE